MPVDQSKVGTHMAEQMEAIEEAYRDVDGDFKDGSKVAGEITRACTPKG